MLVWDWAVASSILLSVVLGAAVATFVLDNVLVFRTNRRRHDDPVQEQFAVAREERRLTRKNSYQQMALIYLNQILNSLLAMLFQLFQVFSIVTHVLTVLWENRSLLLIGLAFGGVAFALQEEAPLILEKLDGFYSCIVTPFVNNIIFSIMYTANLIFSAIAPIYNIIILLIRQIFIGSFQIATKCSTSSLSLSTFFQDIVQYFISILEQTLVFTGIVGDGNILRNDYKIFIVSENLRKAFMWLPDTFTCFCQATADFAELPFYGFIKVDHIDWISHHFFNVPIKFVQTFLRIIPPFLEYPNFSEVFFHVINGFFEIGELFDAWLFETINTVMNVINLNGGIVIEKPSVFVGESLAHVNGAFLQFAQTSANITQHIVLPFDVKPITDTNFMIEVFSMDKVFTHLTLAAASGNIILTWVVRTLVELMLSPIHQKKCVTAGDCLSFVDGQCSVVCLGNGKIKINDVRVKCLYRPDARNRFKYQKDSFDNAANALASSIFSGNLVATHTEYLSLDAKNMISTIEKKGSTYVSRVILGDQEIYTSVKDSDCMQLPMTQRENCLKTFATQELRFAYGLNGESFYASIGCPVEAYASFLINIPHLIYDMIVNFYWYNSLNLVSGKTSLNESGENIRALLAAYVGPMSARDYDPPCYKQLTPNKPTHFEFLEEYNYYLKSNSNNCGKMNLNENVLHHLDRILYFLFLNTLDQQTIGKFVFNLLRVPIEGVRVFARLQADGYGLYNNPKKLYNFKEIKKYSNNPFNLYTGSLGCAYNFGTEDEPVTGFCNDAVFNSGIIESAIATDTCDVYDDNLNASTACLCIEDPKLPNGNYVANAVRNTPFYTRQAVSHWCGINMYEFLYIFLARSINGLRNTIQAFEPSNLYQGFPFEDNYCELSSSEFSTTTTVETIFVSSCKATGTVGFIACPLGELLNRLYSVLSNFVRKEQRNFLYLASANVAKLDLTIWPEVCETQNVMMSLANIVSNTIVFDANLQRPFAVFGYSVINLIAIPFELVMLGLRTARAFVQGDPDIILGGVGDSMNAVTSQASKKILSRSLSLLVKIFTKHLTEVCVEGKTFINALANCVGSSCPGELFNSIQNLARLVEQIFNEVIIDSVVSSVMVVFQFAKFLADPSSVTSQDLESAITGLFKALETFAVEIVKNAAVWVKFLYEVFLGPVGEIVSAVKDIVCTIVGFINDVFQAGIDTAALDCPQRTSSFSLDSAVSDAGDAVGDFFTGIFGRRRRRLLSNSSVLYEVATNLKWDDNSHCDRLIFVYKDWDIEKMNPLEKLEWAKCFENRLLADVLEHKFKIGLPKDLFYNWMRKYTWGFDLFKATLSYVFFKTSENQHVNNFKAQLATQGMNPDHFFNIIKILEQMKTNTFSWKNLKRSLESSFNIHADKKGTRVYKAVREMHSIVSKTHWTASYVKTRKEISKFFNQNIKYPSIQVNSDAIFSTNVREMLALRESFDVNIFGTAYGAFTDLECPSDALLCVNCAFVDNFLYNTLLQFKRASHFYQKDFADVIVPSFEAYWDNVSSYNAKYTRAFRVATEEAVNNAVYGGTLEVTVPFGDLINGIFNGTHSLADLGRGISYFFQGNYTGEIPSDAKIIFPNDLQFYIEALTGAGCEDNDNIYTSHKDNVGNGILVALAIGISPEVFQFFFFRLPLPIAVTATIAAQAAAYFGYLYAVYDYSPTCFPTVPSYLVHDFLYYADNSLFLDCFCGYLPFLAQDSCQQQTCDTCNITATFSACQDVVPAFQELGFAWHFVFFLRWQFQDMFRYFGHVEYWPFTYIFANEGFKMLLSDVDRNLDANGIELNCFYLHLLTPTTILILFYITILASIPIINMALQWAKESVMILINTIMVLYYLSVASNT